jgi:hypothetical protein
MNKRRENQKEKETDENKKRTMRDSNGSRKLQGGKMRKIM